ncbi:MAG: hypothetical protein Q9217_003170 [Psora testacea]
MALTSWKVFNFFDVSEVKPVDDGEASNLFDSNGSSCICSGSDNLFVGSNDGRVRILSQAFKVVRGWTAHDTGTITQMKQVEDTSLLVTIAEDLSNEPVLKVWALDKTDKRTGAPKCLSTLGIHNGRKQFPISAFATLENLSQLAIGFGNGAVTVIRGDLINDRGAKQRTVFESEEPITGVEFREGPNTTLYLATTGRILTLTITGKGQGQPAKVLEDTGCGVGCMTFDDSNGDVVVVRDDAIQYYGINGRGPSYAYEGPKQLVKIYGDYVAIVSSPRTASEKRNKLRRFGGNQGDDIFNTSTFALLDTDLKYMAHTETLISQVRALFIEWGDLFLLTLDGKLYRYHEKTLQQKLEILYQRDLYVLAINFAQKAGVDAAQRNLILRKYGDYLHRKGDYDTAMQQYLKAIDNTEPSQVIRKFLDSQRINNLIEYLEELHDHDKATVDHTTLLLNCYAKLKDTDKLEAFIKSGTHFDLETAISMCRQGGYYDQAVFLARKNQEHELVIDILIEDSKKYDDAIEYIWHLEPELAYPNLMKYARVLLEHCPDDATQAFVEYYTGQYRPKKDLQAPTAPVTQGSTNNAVSNLTSFIPLPYRQAPTAISPATADQFGLSEAEAAATSAAEQPREYEVPKPRTAFSSFVDHPESFITFLEACLKQKDLSQSDKTDLCTTLFEIFLETARSKKGEEKGVWEAKAKQLIDGKDILIDTSNVLLLSHLSNFEEGTVMVKEQQGLRFDIFRSYTSAKDTAGAIKALRKYGPEEPQLYPAALAYFTSSPKAMQEAGDELDVVLKKIDEDGLLAPLQIIQTLSTNAVATMGLVKKYLSNTIEKEKKEISNNRRLIESYRTETESKRQEMDDLGTKPAVFQTRRCAACGRSLDLPTVHFLCKHSFHQNCLNEVDGQEAECPKCSAANNNIRAYRKAQEESANRHDIFQDALQRSRDKFGTIGEFFGRGVMAAPATDDGLCYHIMTVRNVIKDSDEEEERDATPPRRAKTMPGSAMPNILYEDIKNAHMSLMEPTPKHVRESRGAMNSSEHELSVQQSASKIKSRRALTSIEKRKSTKTDETYGSRLTGSSQHANDVFEFRGSSDGEVELSSLQNRKRKTHIDDLGLKTSGQQYMGVEQSSAITNSIYLQDADSSKISKPRPKEQIQHSPANLLSMVTDSTPMLESPSTITPAKPQIIDDQRPFQPLFSDGRMPTPTMSSHGRTDEGNSSKDDHETRETLQPLANTAQANCPPESNHHEPIPAASLISPSRTVTVRRAITKEAGLQEAGDSSKDELHTTRLSFHTAGSARPIVLTPDPATDVLLCDKPSHPTLRKEIEEPTETPKDRKRERQDDDQVDELGSDDITLGLRNEQYQSLQSRSRGKRDKEELVVPPDFSKRPEILAKSKRKSKRCKTTAFHELLPKEEEEDDDHEKSPHKMPDLKIPEFAKNSKASDQVEKTAREIGEQTRDVEPIDKPSAQKKQRGRPKRGPEMRPAQDTVDDQDEPDVTRYETPKPPNAEKSLKRGRPSKKPVSIINEGSEKEVDSGLRNGEHDSQAKGAEKILDETPAYSLLPQQPENAPDASRAVSPATPHKSPVGPLKGPDKHSPISSGKVIAFTVAGAMDQWLDSLSEDWVSQPLSQHSGSITPESPGVNSRGSRSQIPRYMSGTASRPLLEGQKRDRPSSRLSLNSQLDVLKARTPSELNTSQNRAPKGQVKLGSPALSTKQRPKQLDSLRPKPSTLQGTVQHKASPTKDQDAKATPEWKKRIVKREVAKGNQTDLFTPSPAGLEGVFKPPTISPRSPQKEIGKRRRTQVVDAAPILPQRPAAACQRLVSHTEVPVKAHKEVEISRKNPLCHTSPSISNDERNGHESSVNVSASDGSNDRNFSPVYVSKHNTADGRVGYAAVDQSLRHLCSKLDQQRLHKQRRQMSCSPDRHLDDSDTRASRNSIPRNGLDEMTSQSLPQDLSVGTDAFAANGGFVSFKRGGHSDDGSFYRKRLSPSSSLDLNGPRAELPASREKPVSMGHAASIKQEIASPPPKTPQTNQQGIQSSPERPRSSGSPLKLFDNYDTFTNDRLIRRMSKFEETFEHETNEASTAGNEGRSASPSPSTKASRPRHSWTRSAEYQQRNEISRFGEGGFDKYGFPHPDDREPALPQLPRFAPALFHAEVSTRRRNKKRPLRSYHSTEKSYSAYHSPVGTDSSPRLDTVAAHEDQHRERPYDQPEIYRALHGKRLPLSPAKDPARKRRRTVDSSKKRPTADGDAKFDDVEVHETPSKPPVGRKRKDALYDNEQQAADPIILATRQIRRPRNPTPNQASCSTKATPKAAPEPSINAFGRFPDHVKAGVDPPTQIVAGALATVALNTVQDLSCASRKASVTTADFFNEAQQIMQLIRAEKRPYSSHTTADASEMEQQIIYEESVVADSTRDDFSRPPSRERGSLGKVRAPTKLNARVVSHLRKFEDKDDLGLALSSSLKSLKMSRSRIASDASIVNKGGLTGDGVHQSDPPNIRILDRQVDDQHKGRSPSSHEHQSRDDHAHTLTQVSSHESTRRSIPTGSSGSSGNRMVIAPETVAHLLSDQMAGMVFDRQKQMWIKRKGSINADIVDKRDGAASEGTEEDLFGDIPDLSVDEMEELRQVQEAVTVAADQVSNHDHALHFSHDGKHDADCEVFYDGRPETAEGRSIIPGENSSAPSKYSHFASSGGPPSTRATSWGDDYSPQKAQAMQAPTLSAVKEDAGDDHAGEIEHEISILEGRVADAPDQQHGRRHQARVVTVAFSSPLVDHEQSLDLRESWTSNCQAQFDGTPIRYTSQRPKATMRRTSVGFGRKSVHRNASRTMSITSQSYLTRPMSRLDEHEELSIVQYSVKGNRTMDIALTTPLPLSKSLLVPPTTDRRSSMGFHLSPLPDFTVNQIDRPIDAKYSTITRVSGSRSITEAGYQLSITAQRLVKHLTDLEPYEPYWEHIRSIDLHSRGLSSLHMLDEFCSQAEELDVSDNQIGELNGIPLTVRLLNIRTNRLSDLAAWHQLQHLQYLDVSGNDLTSIKGLQSLVHLRALRADDNAIESFDGIEGLNGLLSLSLRKNRLRTIDFEHSDLRRLTDLDVRGNGVLQVSNIERLRSLKTLKFGENNLEAFKPGARLCCLEHLDLADNKLTSIDVCCMPALRTLIVDKNAIRRIDNLRNLDSLNILSWREQRCESGLEYQSSQETGFLYLSSNVINTFASPSQFLNLQALELASTGLRTLSADFGVKFPNLRTINFNFNALHDLRPLLGIAKLQKLQLCGNRIIRLRRTTAVLDRLGKELVEVDLRNNPLTVGFYTPHDFPHVEKRMIVQHRSRLMPETDDNYTMGEAKAYSLPPLAKEADDASRERLDEGTKLRRRVYEMLIISACKNLEQLDGLEVDRRAVSKRDGVWERLVELGILKAKDADAQENFSIKRIR